MCVRVYMCVCVCERTYSIGQREREKACVCVCVCVYLCSYTVTSSVGETWAAKVGKMLLVGSVGDGIDISPRRVGRWSGGVVCGYMDGYVCVGVC